VNAKTRIVMTMPKMTTFVSEFMILLVSYFSIVTNEWLLT